MMTPTIEKAEMFLIGLSDVDGEPFRSLRAEKLTLKCLWKGLKKFAADSENPLPWRVRAAKI